MNRYVAYAACVVLGVAVICFIFTTASVLKTAHVLGSGQRVQGTVLTKYPETFFRGQRTGPKLKLWYKLEGKTQQWVFPVPNGFYARAKKGDHLEIALFPGKPEKNRLVEIGTQPAGMIISGAVTAGLTLFLIARRNFLLQNYGVNFTPPTTGW